MPHCIEEDREFNGMPKFWGFLSSAFYEGTFKVREVTYDLWGNNVSIIMAKQMLHMQAP